MLKKIIITIIGFLALTVAYTGAFTVLETEQGVILQFGKVIRQVDTAGFHWKLPFIQSFEVMEKRKLEWDGPPTQIPTADNKVILVDTFARYKITNPKRYYKALRTEQRTLAKLSEVIKGANINVVSSRSLGEVVRNSDRQMLLNSEETEDATMMDSKGTVQAKGARGVIRDEIFEKVNTMLTTLDLGIELVNLEIKRTSYVASLQPSVFKRMISEQNRIAEKYRAEGQGQNTAIRSLIDRDEKEILSEAYKNAKDITGAANASATKIYAESYEQNPDFYAFLKSLELYENTLSGQEFILSTKHSFLRYLDN